jgi:hypothetical protein
MEFKEKMMDSMMGRMSSGEKKQMMNLMMEKFFKGMTPEEKQEMRREIRPKMMGLMMGGDQAGGGSPMTGMMRSMMGWGNNDEEGFNPMEMCKQMMSTISNTSELATFATPEIRGLFEEWVRQVDEEVLNLLEKNNALTPEEITARLKISRESVIYFLSRLAQRGKVSLQCSKVKEK